MQQQHAPNDVEIIPGTRMGVEWAKLIAEQDLVLDRLPDNFTESLRMGNGDIGVAVYAVHEYLMLAVAKNDLLDYRTKALAHSPEATALTNAVTPMPTTKPAGMIRFRSATPRNPLQVRLSLLDAEVSASPASGAAPEIRTVALKSATSL